MLLTCGLWVDFSPYCLYLTVNFFESIVYVQNLLLPIYTSIPLKSCLWYHQLTNFVLIKF